MGVIINGGVNIGNGRILISSPYVPSEITFNYIFRHNGPGDAILSITGGTFNPVFTPRSLGEDFTYIATGTTTNPVAFGFTSLINDPRTFNAYLYKNGESPNPPVQEIFYGNQGVDPLQVDVLFNGISIVDGDNIAILITEN